MRYLLHDVFTETVKNLPNNYAVIMEDERKITYKELNLLTNKFANLLKSLKKDIREHPFIGIISPVHIESIAAVIGALKIGGTYVPLDEFSPTERLGYIIDSTDLDVIVVDINWYEKHYELFEKPQIKKIIVLGSSKSIKHKIDKCLFIKNVLGSHSKEPAILNQVSDDLAYILHSSGSTGIPKGIMLTHRNARTFVDWMQKEFKLTKKDKVMSRAPFKFDLSVFDIFNTFKIGATLVCYDWNKDRGENRKHIDYVKLMEREKTTILYTTPSTFISLMNRGRLGEANLKLREIMYAGEPFPTPQLRKLQNVLPDTRIANIYGPTETNIITYYWIDNLPKDNSPIPLGDVVEDTEILIVSEDCKRICKPNEMGEIWCRGGTVTIGYLGMEDKTKEHFVESPFHKYPVYFWRTGDYGYRDETGCLYYKGRKDHMVKVKGYRIEIGEVEAAISAYEAIDEFVVVAVPDEKYSNRLYCYYSVLKGRKIISDDIKTFLKTKLPEYMIPFKFIELNVLPKTSSGKVDRVLLSKKSQEQQSV